MTVREFLKEGIEMNAIDRMFWRIKKISNEEKHTLSIIERDGKGYVSRFSVCNMAMKEIRCDVSNHCSIEDAISHVHKLEEKYSNDKDSVIIINDVGGDRNHEKKT